MPLGFFSSSTEQRVYIRPRLAKLWPTFTTGGDVYRQAIRQVLKNGMTVLDAGCGTGGIISEFRPQITKLVGVDCDANAVQHNPLLDVRVVADLANVQLESSSVDLITGEFVLEHLDFPDRVFSELERLLRPDGSAIFLTSNVRHPVMAMSRITPTAWHRWWKQSVLHKTEGAWPTRYRVNTEIAIRRVVSYLKNVTVDISYAGNPEYLAFHTLTTNLAIRFERWLASAAPTRQMYMVVTMKKTP